MKIDRSNDREGNSDTLKFVFNKLKSADKKFGYFNPINLIDLQK